MKSTLTFIGRILIILAVAAVIIAALSALTLSTGGGIQPTGFEPNLATGAPAFRPERGEVEGGFGMLELIKNVGVIGLIVTAYWFIQNWVSQFRRKGCLAV